MQLETAVPPVVERRFDMSIVYRIFQRGNAIFVFLPLQLFAQVPPREVFITHSNLLENHYKVSLSSISY